MVSRALTMKYLRLSFASLLVLSACKQEESVKDKVASEKTPATGDTSANQQAIVPLIDYPKLYCENIGLLKLRADVSEEISFFCNKNYPSADLIKFRSQALKDEPGKFQLTLLQAEHKEDSDESEFLIVWSFRVPIRPYEVKSRPLYKFVSQGFTTEDVKLVSSSTLRTDDPLDSGLQLWSADMDYALTIKGTQGLNLESKRKTQYNLYQVQSGNEEMGFGVEHLVGLDNPDFKKSTMLNVSFNDGAGYNDGKGGTIVVTLLHFVLNNQGFPSTATKSIQEIARNIADGMYEGLKQ